MAEKSERVEREEEVLRFWQDNKIFEKSLEKKAPKGEFVFYDGPPFATGLPHAGSLLSSVIKDVIPRYKTMQGFHVRRRWGWDCHGLPIENMIEKELSIKDKTEIEGKIGIEAFNEACRSSVLRYAGEWKQYVDRVGRWVDYDNAYKTMDNTFIESVWHALKNINEKGLLYEGRKVLLYCPHCQTPIAKAEIAMDNSYKDVTEESVFIKFKIKGTDKSYFLAWTTTPWTLPGNVALAVGKDIDYVEVELGGENLFLAKARLEILPEGYKVIRELKGGDLVDMEYEPLFDISAVRKTGKKAFYVAPADFVTTEEGTGIVHTAVIYGEDDYNLGLKLNLPMVPLLDAAGHFNSEAPELVRGQYFKKAERMIKEDLEQRSLMFKRMNHTHSYPHCHRCGTALLYNAISSWFINIEKVKSRMIELNEKVNWVPEHLKHGRFLNIVENAPDWTISRNRYWASPLPIWKDQSGKVYVLGSLDELKKYTKKSGNKYFVMRHGRAQNNELNVASGKVDNPHHLTEDGKLGVTKSAQEFKEKIDLIFVSPFIRTKETAEIVRENLGLSHESVIEDDRLVEINFGECEGKSIENYQKAYPNTPALFNERPQGGENEQDVKKRVGEFLYEIENKYKGKNILIVSHGDAVWMAQSIAEGADIPRMLQILEERYPKYAEINKLDFVPIPHNNNFELDLHRPYIDEVELVAEDGLPMKRIPEVIDGWVESGAMPFAEYHYPFENKNEFEKRFPGDFVAEYIAQTRTWFYYMHALGTILLDKQTFNNVISTGNILAADGSKMSKSKGNYTDPLILLNTIGADAFRYYLMSSVVMQAEDMLFKDEEIKDVNSRLINILANSFKLYELYADDTEGSDKSEHVLDRWILARFNELVEEVTEAMDNFDTVKATRPVKDFVTDLSTWYIRRSRDRFKSEDVEEKKHVLATSRFIFTELSKLIAPVMPFIAEEIYQKVRGEGEPMSVHLADWPEAKKSGLFGIFGGDKSKELLMKMTETRRLVSLALEARNKANIKVRQPLSKLEVKTDALSPEYLEIIKDELNVKEVVVNNSLSSEIDLETELSEELIEEGKVRDAIRAIQEWRKEQGLKPGEVAQYPTPDEFYIKHKQEIEKATNVELSHLHN
ncbi:class I tRNA ligase family protein [Candidatus Parcubacteria bacterium]|nr:class I tRNA ligase family protein [Candidatus Parcubacteria bacterium]